MSDTYVTLDGYRPLALPLTGEELIEGRQYALTPLARLILREEYGLAGIPTVVECLHKKVAKTTITTSTLNHETNEVKVSVMQLEAQPASFRVFLAVGRILKFELDIAKLEEFAPFYDKSHKLPEMEAEWFAQRHLTPVHHKFRGCSLRWWSKNEQAGTAARISSGGAKRVSARTINLSDLD